MADFIHEAVISILFVQISALIQSWALIELVLVVIPCIKVFLLLSFLICLFFYKMRMCFVLLSFCGCRNQGDKKYTCWNGWT